MTLHEEAIIVVRDYRKNEHAVIEILTKIDKAKAFLEEGYSSLFSYCVGKLGLTESETYRFTQVTRKTYEVPQLKEVISQGVLSVSQASRIASVIQPNTAEMWIEMASGLNQKDLEREVKKGRPEIAQKPRLKVLNESQSELKLVITKSQEEKLQRVQEVLGTRDMNETLEKMVQIVLKHKDPIEKAKRAQIKSPASRKVHLPLRLRQPLSAALKHQVMLRDGGKCTFRNCGQKRWTEIHHVQPIALGGKNELSNLTTVCSAHHKYVHSLA